MNFAKSTILAASMLAGTVATGANAQIVFYPDTDVLHGIGASSITYVIVQDLNCLSGNNPAAESNGTTRSVPEGNFVSTSRPLNCATTDLQPNNSGLYVATGSGDGIKGWSTFSRVFGLSSSNATINPFDLANTDPAWAHYQFALSDIPILQNDQSTYVASSNTNKLGNAIQIPLFVLPVAIAYNPVYGRDTVNNKDLKFNVKSTYVQKDAAGNPIGGLRLTRSNYCEIFNGVITDWTDPKLKLQNDDLSLLDSADPRGPDAPTPIRLVGRSDFSGTTDIFTRHLAAVCGTDVALGGPNKFNKAAGGLPYHNVINLTSVDSGTAYNGTFSAATFSNSANDAAHQSLSGAFFNKTTQTIVTTVGAEAPGKFLVSNGSSGVADAIKLAPDAPSTAGVLLNGRIGYIGADYVAPAALGTGIFSAAMQMGRFGSFLMPHPENAAAAFGTILPPQSIAASGFYSTADARTVFNPTTKLNEPVDRANPLHWTDVLYSNPANTLAKPAKGYPITGVTSILAYQCYANAATRLSITNLIGLVVGKVRRAFPLFINPSSFILSPSRFLRSTNPGINVQSGIAPLPGAWRTAIAETFLKNSSQLGSAGGGKLGQINVTYDAVKRGYYTVPGLGNGLWIQDKIPESNATVASAASNANCTPGAGA